jgi:hypothetical protein
MQLQSHHRAALPQLDHFSRRQGRTAVKILSRIGVPASSSCRLIEKLHENGWSLAAGRYKPVTTAVNHDAPADIVTGGFKLENDVIRGGGLLLRQVHGRKVP